MTKNYSPTLEEINWNFPESGKSRDINNIHPYPAKFIPEIPKSLIDIFPPPEGTIVFDPFCGSGTTLLEAQKAGFESLGVDLNPIACLITSVKTSILNTVLFENIADSVIRKAQSSLEKVELPDIPNLNHWFKEDIQVEIAKLLIEIRKIEEKSIHDALLLALSSILVRISNQDSDTRYAAIEKNLNANSVYDIFKKSTLQIKKAKSVSILDFPQARVIQKNILEVTTSDIEKKVGLVITSPPYPNAYEYWLYHKYRMFWLGYDPLEVKKKEIGARAHYYKKNPPTNQDFQNEMQYLLQLIWDSLVDNGKACFIIGRSKIRGEIVDNAELITSAAYKVGFTRIAKIERVIAPSRKSFNLSHGKIKVEHILVFNK